MAKTLISEALRPDGGTFDTAAMSRGEPGLPGKFRWRDRDLTVAEVLESGREFGDCSHGSGERYVRKHVYRVRMTTGEVMKISFQRTFGRAKRTAARWWLHSMEEPAGGGANP